MIDDGELAELVSEARSAMAAPAHARVSLMFEVMPKMVNALDRVSQYQHDLKQVRVDLTAAVRKLREEVWEAQKQHPELTYRAAHVHAAMREVNVIIDRLQRLIYQEQE